MRAVPALAMLTLVGCLGGCQLYFDGDDEPPTCTPYYEDQGYEVDLRRNLETGYCEEIWGGGGGGCDSCGNCDDAVPEPAGGAQTWWPTCESLCNTLDEATCITEPGCQVAYWEITDYQDAPSVTSFRGCYPAQDGGYMPGACWELDAFRCNLHDECALFYTPLDATPIEGEPARFSRCAPEPTNLGCDNVHCGTGYHCENQCSADPDCVGGKTDADCQQCSPMCVPDEDYSCAAIDCAPGYECVETCTDAATVPGGVLPGECSGACVPLTSCELLADQPACDARTDCTSVFVGEDCTCYPGGSCECEVLTWDRCESL